MNLNANDRLNIETKLNQLYECKSLSENDVKLITDKVNHIKKIGKRNSYERR